MSRYEDVSPHFSIDLDPRSNTEIKLLNYFCGNTIGYDIIRQVIQNDRAHPNNHTSTNSNTRQY